MHINTFLSKYSLLGVLLIVFSINIIGQTANFSANTTSGCDNLTVFFTNQSTGDNNWSWDFGDGGISSLENPSHVYANPGTYSVTLIINGGAATETKSAYITVFNTPSPNFTPSATEACAAPFVINFSNTTQGSGIVYSWDFNDGNTSTQSNPSNTFSALGVYTVTLTADNNGCSGFITKTITAEAFVADFNASNTEVCLGQSVTLSNASNDGVSNYNWNWGGGVVGTNPSPTYTYPSPGTYSITYTAVSTLGCTDTEIKTNLILVKPLPSVGINLSDDSACQAPFIVNFTSTTDIGTTFSWNFGDGNTSSQANPSHTYLNTGIFNVALTITSPAPDNCSAKLVLPNKVKIIAPEAIFSSDRQNGCTSLAVSFTDNSFSNEPITNWLWDFGNGNTSTASNPSNTYNDTGSFDVSLTILNDEGCTSTTIIQNYIQTGIPPIINITPTNADDCHPFPVSFTDLSSAYGDEWLWDFGNGNSSAAQNPSHTYTDTGYFDVGLKVGFHGCYDSAVFNQAVHVKPAKPDFSVNNTSLCNTPYTLSVTDLSQGSDSWNWNWGDGSSDTGPAPAPHVYNTAGSYTVTLTASNSINGCSDSFTLNIIASSLTAGFSTDDSIGCRPHEVNFTDLSTSNNSIVSWTWNYGNGNNAATQNPAYTYNGAGIFDVVFTTTDSAGCTKSITKNNLMDIKDLPSPNYTIDTAIACTPAVFNFTDNSSGPASMSNWLWIFNSTQSSTSQNPSFTTTNNGYFDLSLKVTDANGCIDSLQWNDIVLSTRPSPNFSFDTAICFGDTSIFTNTSSGGLLSYQWHFEDDSISTAANPVYLYNSFSNENQIFNVQLNLTDTNGCKDSLVKPLLISKPQAQFTVNDSISNCPPLNVVFSDNSVNAISSYAWDFGNGQMGVNATAIISYTLENNYTIEYMVTDIHGCKDTLIKTNFIQLSGPSGAYTYAIDSNTCKQQLTFYSTHQNTDEVIWDFNDGSTGFGDTISHRFAGTGGIFIPTMTLSTLSGCAVTIASDTLNIPEHNLVSAPFADTTQGVSGSEITFDHNSTGPDEIIQYLWKLDEQILNSSDSLLQQITHKFDNTGDFTLWLIVQDTKGCIDSNLIDISIINDITDQINIITPNNDGINDLFIIQGYDVLESDVKIFNRWGQLVYAHIAPVIEWGGRDFDGNTLVEGTYFYISSSTLTSGEIKLQKGTITLLR